jgi:hypothetical protein
MAKTTPTRLDDALLKAAAQKGARTNRSAAAQIERWALVGRVLEGDLTDAQIEAVAAGLAQVKVVAAAAPRLPALDDILTEVQQRRDAGELTAQVAGPVRYRATSDGVLERVTPDGVQRGSFIDGKFVPDES